jgi:hypothetical protein
MVGGSCLCAAVRFEIDGELSPIQFDHCSRCRKASGSAFAAELIARSGSLRWVQGSECVRTWEAPVRERPPGYRRAFCAVCGGPLPIDDPAGVIVPAGTLDSDPGSRPARHLFVGVKAPWFEIADALPRFERNVPGELRW